MTIFHVYGDADGATHLARVELTPEDSPVGPIRGLRIPATAANVVQFVNRKPDLGLHASGRRQCFVVLEGVLEVIPMVGDAARLVPGDIFLADDVGSQGHTSRDVGEVVLTVMVIPVDPDWAIPAPAHSR